MTDLNSVGPSLLANLVHSQDAAILRDFRHRNYKTPRCQFAQLLYAEDKRLSFKWAYGAGVANFTATEVDTLNRLANKVRHSV
ncbi:hypothetical protein [Pseudomonas phage Njord]|uniref:Uncharacterized protein n=1 Tax=Pseudomonas phage Njord TaxID=2163985 RepID=A0A2S1GMH6_9CAUD|nr:hypothetical protein HOT08_gp03 [Pseudomonas phage Njord]AWD90591.1 hypothetical protein [Pseudomonas phage Njord]